MNEFQTKKMVGEKENIPVLRLPYKEIEGAFIIVSFRHETVSLQHLDFYYKYREPHYPQKSFVTFFYANEKWGTEWEPRHGPIQIYEKCEKDWVGKDCFDKEIKAKAHWFFDYVKNESASWSQLAVNERNLKPALARGDFKHIFYVLKDWANRDDADNGDK